MNVTTERAREIAAGYISSADCDAEMTRFATTGQANGYALLECIEHNARMLLDHPEYNTSERCNIREELDYLREWVREFHGRYAVTVCATEYGEWEEGADEPEKVSESDKTIMFDTFREIVDYLNREGAAEASVYPGPYTVNTWVSATYDNPTAGHEDTTFHATHGLTDRGWNAILRTALAR
jgi:hypothetical protein